MDLGLSGRRTREPVVRSLTANDLIRNSTDFSPTRHQPQSYSRGREVLRPSAQTKKIRLDEFGKEREARKVSNRENFEDVGPGATGFSQSLRQSRRPLDYSPDRLYDYSSAEDVRYLNDCPTPERQLSPYRRSQRRVDTIVPFVPRLDIIDVPPAADYSPQSSARSEKVRRTLKDISMNGENAFPTLKARIEKQRQLAAQYDLDQSNEENQDQGGDNVNNNAAISQSEENQVQPAKKSSDDGKPAEKSAHCEDDPVKLNQSVESVNIRPIKRKIASAPEVKTFNKRSASASADRNSAVTKPRSKSASDVKSRPPVSRPSAINRPSTSRPPAGAHSTTRWVEKTPGDKNRHSSVFGDRSTGKSRIRPDSWRDGMENVRRELAKKNISLPQQKSKGKKSISGERNLPAAAKQVLNELKSDSDSESHNDLTEKSAETQPSPTPGPEKQPVRVRKTKRAQPQPESRPEPVPKSRHYDPEAIHSYMERKKREAKLAQIQEKKRREEEERARAERLKALQMRSLTAIRSRPPTRPVNSTYTTRTKSPAAPRTEWQQKQKVIESRYEQELRDVGLEKQSRSPVSKSPIPFSTTPTKSALSKSPVSKSPRSKSSLTKSPTAQDRDTDNEGDTTLTEADLVGERSLNGTPKSHSSTPVSRSPRSGQSSSRLSPLTLKNRAAEEEVEELLREARLRNQQIRTGDFFTPSTGTSSRSPQNTHGSVRNPVFSPGHHRPYTSSDIVIEKGHRTGRMATLAETTAHLMDKMDMLKANIERTAARSPYSRTISPSYHSSIHQRTSPYRGLFSSGLDRPGSQSAPTYWRTNGITTRAWDSRSATTLSDSRSHSTVTSDEEEGEVDTNSVSTVTDMEEDHSSTSSLDIRIKAALSRNQANSVLNNNRRTPTQASRVQHVSRNLFSDDKAGDEHSVVNTYLRKLQAERQALTQPVKTGVTPPVDLIQPPVTRVAYKPSAISVTEVSTQAFSHPSTQNYSTQTERRTFTESSVQYEPKIASSRYERAVSPPVTKSSQTTVFVNQPATQVADDHHPASYSSTDSRRPASELAADVSRPPVTVPPQQTNGQTYAPSTQQRAAVDRRISPAGLDLALTAGITLLDSLGEQQRQVTDVEKTRFSTLAQQETVALAQLLKTNRDKHEQQLINIRQKIREDELEAQRKLDSLKQEATSSTQAESQLRKQAVNEETALKVLQAQTETTQAFTEVARMLNDRKSNLETASSNIVDSTSLLVNTLKTQNETVGSSFTQLMDQQRQQTAELFRRAHTIQSQSQTTPQATVTTTSSSMGSQSSERKSPLGVRQRTKSPRDRTRSPRDKTKSPRELSRSPRNKTRSPREYSRSLQSRGLERSKASREITFNESDSTSSIQSAAYSDDFSSPTSGLKGRDTADGGKTSSTIKSESDIKTVLNSTRSEEQILTDMSVQSSVSTADHSPEIRTESISMKYPSQSQSLSKSSIQTASQPPASIQTTSQSAASIRTASQSAASIRTASQSGSQKTEPPSDTLSSTHSQPLHQVVLGAVKEIFKDDVRYSDPTFAEKLRSVLIAFKDGTTPIALSTPSKISPHTSPHKPPMVAPLSPRTRPPAAGGIKKLNVTRARTRTTPAADSESDESHSLLATGDRLSNDTKPKRETASDTDQESQLSALQHQLEEAKRRHAMMKKARQKYELHKKQEAYRKQIEYYEEDMSRMKKEMDQLQSMSSNTSQTQQVVRPQIKQPRAPSASGSGSDNGSTSRHHDKKRHSSGPSDSEHRPILSAKNISAQLPSGGTALPYRQRTESQKSDVSQLSVSESDTEKPSRIISQKSISDKYGDDFESEVSQKSESSPKPSHSDDKSTRDERESSLSESIIESIAESIRDSISESSESNLLDLSNHSKDLLDLSNKTAEPATNQRLFDEEPDLLNLEKPAAEINSVFVEHRESPQLKAELGDGDTERPDSVASSKTLTDHSNSRPRSRSRSHSPHTKSISRSSSRSRSASKERSISQTHSVSRSRSPSRSRSLSRSRSSRSRSRSKSPFSGSWSESYSRSRSRSRSDSRTRSRSRSTGRSPRTITDGEKSPVVRPSSPAETPVSPKRSSPIISTSPIQDIESIAESVTSDIKSEIEDEAPLMTLDAEAEKDLLKPAVTVEKDNDLNLDKQNELNTSGQWPWDEQPIQQREPTVEPAVVTTGEEPFAPEIVDSHSVEAEEFSYGEDFSSEKSSPRSEAPDIKSEASEIKSEASFASSKHSDRSEPRTEQSEHESESEPLMKLDLNQKEAETSRDLFELEPSPRDSEAAHSIRSDVISEKSDLKSPRDSIVSEKSDHTATSPRSEISSRSSHSGKTTPRCGASEKTTPRSVETEKTTPRSAEDSDASVLSLNSEPDISTHSKPRTPTAEIGNDLISDIDDASDVSLLTRTLKDNQTVGELGTSLHDELTAALEPQTQQSREIAVSGQLERLTSIEDEAPPEFVETTPEQSAEPSPRDEPVRQRDDSLSEDELERAISSAALAVEESIASELQIDLNNVATGDARHDDSQAGPSIIDELTPRSLISLGSSTTDEGEGEDLLKLDDVTSPSHDVTSPSHDVTSPSHDVTSPSHDQLQVSHDVMQPYVYVTSPSLDVTSPSGDILSTIDESSPRPDVLESIGSGEISHGKPYEIETKLSPPPEEYPPAEEVASEDDVHTPLPSPTQPYGREAQIRSTADDLVKSAVSSVLALWKEKKASFSQSETPDIKTEEQSEASEKAEDPIQKTPVAAEPEKKPELVKSPPDSKSKDTSSSLLGSLPPLGPSADKSPPKSADTPSISNLWAEIDKGSKDMFGSSSGDDWFDEDFGLTQVKSPPSPRASSGETMPAELPSRAILEKVVQEPVFAVPHKEEEVLTISDAALDLFWQARRCGESWSEVTPTSDFLSTEDKIGVEATSLVSFKKFVFDLVRDLLLDMYQDEEETEQSSVNKTRGPLGRIYKYRNPPTVLDNVRKIIQNHTYPLAIGDAPPPNNPSRAMLVARAKRRDRVDQILTHELREEEPDWLDYSQDEVSVKRAVTEDVFNHLFDDSIKSISNIYSAKRQKLSKGS